MINIFGWVLPNVACCVSDITHRQLTGTARPLARFVDVAAIRGSALIDTATAGHVRGIV